MVVLGIGTMMVLLAQERKGLALVDLSKSTITAIAEAPQRELMYAELTAGSHPGGIYRSNDAGRTWQWVGPGFGRGHTTLNTLAVSPVDEQVLYAGTAAGPMETTNNVWRSTDGGATWHNFNLNLPADPDHTIPAVTAIVPDPAQPGLLYVGTDGHGVYRIQEGQLGFALVGGLSLHNAQVKQLALAAHQLYALTRDGLFVTAGDTWHKLPLPEMAVTFAVAARNPHLIYAGSSSTGLHRSTDGGQTWQSLNEGLELRPGVALRVTSISLDEGDENHLVVGTAYGIGRQLTAGGVYESQDGGLHWQTLTKVEALVQHLSLQPEGIQAVTANGIVRYGGVAEATAPASQTLSFVMLGLVVVVLLALAGLVLLNQVSWAAANRQNSDYFHLGVTK
jgi:photosystem II stability/assembly factor-like uncharacterized protein